MVSNGSKPRVLILGGGFAGIGAAQGLKDADVEVVLVDGHDYHTFQPLIYQVATDLLAPTVVGHPIRDLFHEQPNVAVHQATAEKLDLDDRQVQFAEMETSWISVAPCRKRASRRPGRQLPRHARRRQLGERSTDRRIASSTIATVAT